MRWRLMKACAVLLAIACIIPGVEVVSRLVQGSSQLQAQAAMPGLHSEVLNAAADPFESLDKVEALVEGGAADLPEAFCAEVGFLPNANDVRCHGGGAVVGYSVEGGEDETLEKLVEHMRCRGWTSVPLGEVCGATFLKDEGRYTWVLATCTQVGSATCVVMRSVST